MGFFGIKKKIAKFTDFEIDDIEDFINKANLELKKINLKFEFNADTLKSAKLEKSPNNNTVNTDCVNYNLINDGKIINKIYFRKYYINNFINDEIFFRIRLENDDIRHIHTFEKNELGVKFHSGYNTHAQLPSIEHIDYSDYKPSKIYKNERLKFAHFEDFKNELGRSYEEYLSYMEDQRKRIIKYLQK